MALSRKNIAEIPKDAVLLSSEHALAYEWKIIENWESVGDVWSLKYTPGILGSFSALTGIFVNKYYRSKLRLGNYGKLSTYLPIVVIPAMFSVLAHKMFVQQSIILEPMRECPLCLQLRASAFQTGIGVVYPTLLAPLSAMMFATRHYTYRLPSITEQPIEVLHFLRKMTKPILPLLGTVMIGQAIITMFLTYKQSEQHLHLQAKMHQIEDNIENS